MREYQPQPQTLVGRVIAITGAYGSVGRAVAMAAAYQGAEVILIGRNVKKLEAVFAAIEAENGLATIAPLNLETSPAQEYDALAAAISSRFGRLDGLLHNAAILGQLSPIDHYDVPTWCRVMQVNVTAAFALTQVLMPQLRASISASVVFTSSGAGRRGYAYWGAYCASKFAIEGLMQTLAEECAHLPQLRVNAINPGPTQSAMRRAAYPAEAPNAAAKPGSLVNAYLWLLGPASQGVTGHSLDVQPPRA
jgi:NAD(P)-dependent dehydrogenase (short-subunit alcohol dehydrogenase family)